VIKSKALEKVGNFEKKLTASVACAQSLLFPLKKSLTTVNIYSIVIVAIR